MAYADKFPTSMKKGGMKKMKTKSVPKAQVGMIIKKAAKKAVKYAKDMKAALSEKMWPTGHLRRGEDWDAHYRQKANDKLKIAAGAGLGTAGVAGAVANKKKEAEKKKTMPKKQFAGGVYDMPRGSQGPVKKPSMLEEKPNMSTPSPTRPSPIRQMNVEENQRRALTTGDTSSGPMFKKTDPKDMFKFDGKMKKGGMKTKMKKGGFPDLNKDGKITKADILKGRGVFKKGGSIMKTAGKTTTGVISDYKGYKGPTRKTPMTKLKKSK